MATGGEDTRVLHGERVELRRLGEDDVEPLLALWAGDPSVRERWPTWTREEVRSVAAGSGGSGGWWIIAEAEQVGFIQHYQEPDPEYRHAGIDVFLVARAQGRGLGTDAVRTLARYLTGTLGHHRLVIDPAADNERAIRCYRRVGFRPVGIMREYERGADGSFHDGLLMDLLARELT